MAPLATFVGVARTVVAVGVGTVASNSAAVDVSVVANTVIWGEVAVADSEAGMITSLPVPLPPPLQPKRVKVNKSDR